MKGLTIYTISPIQPPPPMVAPTPPLLAAHHQQQQQQQYLKRGTSSLNALSFGFLATAILISVFLVVALFERFLHRPPSSASSTLPTSAPDNAPFAAQPSGVASYNREDIGMIIPDKRCFIGVSVLMPGQDVPTFIASPAPITHFRESHDDDDDDGNNVGLDNPTRDVR